MIPFIPLSLHPPYPVSSLATRGRARAIHSTAFERPQSQPLPGFTGATDEDEDAEGREDGDPSSDTAVPRPCDRMVAWLGGRHPI